MMERYKLIIDGEEAKTSSRIQPLKKHASLEFETSTSAFYAEIRTGSKLYAWRRYDTEWKRA